MTVQSSGGVQQVARVGGNTIDTGTIPIVFVPGIMGSRLFFNKTKLYWDPDHNITRMRHWLLKSGERVRLNFRIDARINPAEVMSDGDQLSASQRRRGWGGVAWGFYGPLLEHLEGQSYGAYDTPVYAIGYDWRKSNEQGGAAIATRLEEILAEEDAERFILISHSMGGLATRAALKGNAGVAAKLAGVCHIAQPATGAAVAVRRMFTGATFSGDGLAMMALLGTNRQKFQTICSALPGAMQLLATQDFTATDGSWWYTYRTFERPNDDDAWEGLCWGLYAQPQSPPGLLAPADSRHTIPAVPRREFNRRLAEARAFHMDMGLWKHDNTWTFYGTGNKTDTSVHFRLPPLEAKLSLLSTALHSLNPFTEDIRYKARRADGSEVSVPGSEVDPADRGCVLQRTDKSDGTVPVASAKALFTGPTHEYAKGTVYDFETQRQFYADGGKKHDKICSDPKCVAFVDDLINHLVGS